MFKGLCAAIAIFLALPASAGTKIQSQDLADNLVISGTFTAGAFAGGGLIVTSTSADQLTTNGTNCAAGQAARGIDQFGNAESCFTPPSATLTLSTGSLLSASQFPLRSTAIFDSAFFLLTDSAAANATFITLASVPSVTSSSQALRTADIAWGSTLLNCKSTITVSGSTFTIIANISHSVPGAGSMTSGYLVDGACPQGHTCTLSQSTVRTPWKQSTTGADALGMTIHARETRASGSHSFCIWSANDVGGTATANFLDFRVEYQ